MRVALLLLVTILLASGGVCLLSCGEPLIVAPPPAWEYRADGRYEGPPVANARRMNLVVLILDTMRADCIGNGPDADGDMPFVSALGRRGLLCTRMTAPAPATYPSMASLLTGLLPDQHRVDHGPYPALLPAGVTTYAEALARGHGYETAAVLEVNLDTAPNSLLQGFGYVRCGGPLRFGRDQISSWNKLRDPAKPFFLLLQTYEAHDPYGAANHPWPITPPSYEGAERAREIIQEGDAAFVEHFLLDRDVRLTWLQNDPSGTLKRTFRYYGEGYARNPAPGLAQRLEKAYRLGARWLDGEVEKTVTQLERAGLLENTLLVITSDHGEAFGEHGILNHGRALYDELVHVPFVALGPAPFDKGRSVDTSMGLIDVLPTFFELTGLPALQDVPGRSMLAALTRGAPGRAVLSVEELTPFKLGRASNARIVSARTATESYIITYDVGAGTVVEQFYDRASDPGEQRDLAVTGQLGNLGVSVEMAEAIERARDRVWVAVATSQAHVQSGYGAGVGTVTSARPARAALRTP